jgi:hypothetical protein
VFGGQSAHWGRTLEAELAGRLLAGRGRRSCTGTLGRPASHQPKSTTRGSQWLLNKKRRAFCLSVDSDCEKWMRALDSVQSLPPFLHHSLRVNGCSNHEMKGRGSPIKPVKLLQRSQLPNGNSSLPSGYGWFIPGLLITLRHKVAFRLINQNGIPKVASECRFSEQ